MSLTHQLIALLVTFIWGTNFVLIKLGLAELPPFLLATLRFLLVAFPLVLFLPRPKVPWWSLVSYGVLIGFGQFGLLFWAMQSNISPGLASLVIQIQAFFTILMAAMFFGEMVKPAQIMALVICFAGLLLIMMNTDGHTTWLGLGIVLVGAVSWAGGNLIVKHAGRVDIIAFIAWSSLFSIPPLAIMSLWQEGWQTMVDHTLAASVSAWGIVLWQTIGNTLIGYGLWNMLLGRYSASLVTPWALLVPVFGMSASAVLLNESMPWWKITAALLILSGLIINILVTRKPRKASA